MMKDSTEVMLETVIVSALNIAAVYVAAFTYKLKWSGVMSVMILASLFTASITHFVLSKMITVKGPTSTLVSEGLSVISVVSISSIAVLVILVQRFNFLEALGISVLSGLLTSLIRHVMTMV